LSDIYALALSPWAHAYISGKALVPVV